MARTLNSSRPIGSVGSCREPPRLGFDVPLGEVVDDLAGVGQ